MIKNLKILLERFRSIFLERIFYSTINAVYGPKLVITNKIT
jgi:hypothetical protein